MEPQKRPPENIVAPNSMLRNSYDSGCSHYSMVIKPISENPQNFSEMLQEELRTRLMLIKQALQRSQPDEEFLNIQNAFSNKQMKVFGEMVNISSSLDME